MAYKMREIGRAVDDEDLRRLESETGTSLPQEYKDFLKQNNGGRPSPKFFPIKGFANNPIGQVLDFFGIDDQVKSCRLDWNHKTLLGKIPANMFAIACEDGGSLICLSLSGEDKGRIYYWDFYGQTERPSYENVYFVAETFHEFLASLHHADPLAGLKQP